IFDWKINPPFSVVEAHILPKIRKLKCRAGEIGKLLPFRIAVSAEIQNQMSHWICRVPAVAQQVIEEFVAGCGLVLAEGGQEVGKLVLGNIKLAHRPRQSYKDRVTRRARVAGVQLAFPFIE